jgi:hypothetical protein
VFKFIKNTEELSRPNSYKAEASQIPAYGFSAKISRPWIDNL